MFITFEKFLVKVEWASRALNLSFPQALSTKFSPLNTSIDKGSQIGMAEIFFPNWHSREPDHLFSQIYRKDIHFQILHWISYL